jgi:ribonuclease D
MKGSRALDGIGLAVLAELATLRDREARRRGRPPFRILMDETLVFLAANPKADLKEAPGVGPITLERMGKAIRQALQRGMEAPPIERPAPALPPRRPMNSPENARWEALKQWRTQQGQALALDPALVWPMASLERLGRDPDAFNAELRAPEVRRWQAKRFGPLLQERLAVLAGRQTQQAKQRPRWQRFLGRHS